MVHGLIVERKYYDTGFIKEAVMNFQLEALVTVSAYTEVEAESLEEAISMAESRPVTHGSDMSVGPATDWIVDDMDGMPTNIVDAEEQ